MCCRRASFTPTTKREWDRTLVWGAGEQRITVTVTVTIIGQDSRAGHPLIITMEDLGRPQLLALATAGTQKLQLVLHKTVVEHI